MICSDPELRVLVVDRAPSCTRGRRGGGGLPWPWRGASTARGAAQGMTARQEKGISPLRLDDRGPKTVRDGKRGTSWNGFVAPYPISEYLALTDAPQLLGPALLDKLGIDGL